MGNWLSKSVDTLIAASLAEYAAIKRQFTIGFGETQEEDQSEDEQDWIESHFLLELKEEEICLC